MGRLDRLKEYAGKPRGLQGAGRDMDNIRGWQARASENSQIAPRAKGPVHGGPPGTWGEDPPSLPSTKVNMRDTAMRPKISHRIDRLMSGTDPGDKNNVGSSYMKSVRREA